MPPLALRQNPCRQTFNEGDFLRTSIKRTIKAKEIVSDIRSGMTDEQLMDKQDVSIGKLQDIFNKLLDAHPIEHSELELLASVPPAKLDVNDRRQLHRKWVFIRLPITALEDLLYEGRVVDITETGIQMAGIPTKAGDTKEFLVRADYFTDVYPFVFEAQCLWVSGAASGGLFSGFKITSISEEGLKELQKVTRMLTISG